MPPRKSGCRPQRTSKRLTEPFTASRLAPAQRPPSRREVLWNELESLHAQLQLPLPTETYTIEELEAVVAQLQTELDECA
jgi:hypothetical protein